ASAVYWGAPQTPKQRTKLFAKDIQVNKLQRKIRKQIVTHLIGSQHRAVAYALLVMSLVKDVERLGDYARNLVELVDMRPDDLPEDEQLRELTEIRESVETLVREVADVFLNSDEDRAAELTFEGRATCKRCDELIWTVGEANYPGATAIFLALGSRFYKRIGGHALNLLSGVIMPLHKIDYFDERVIDETER
ncbi:MAG: hypothetical protein JRI68_35760, partial [Deltaproteobacteria bacterium]|nr:hypothetical protein [Deltaproteobacteria bacterium]